MEKFLIIPHFFKALVSYMVPTTVNLEIFARILFLRIALKHIFATLKIRDKGVIYLYK